MDIRGWLRGLGAGKYDEELDWLYRGGVDARGRYSGFLRESAEFFAGEDVEVISAPGRTELMGNHTDHQRGRVLAAAVTQDMVAAVAALDEPVAELESVGFGAERIEFSDLDPRPEEKNTTAALIRGVACALADMGYKTGGWRARCVSGVPAGSGMSSSAAFETLVGNIFSELYNDGGIPPEAIAIAGQRAENIHFGKPSGLMDQMASSCGSAVYIDFKDPKSPVIEHIDCDFAKLGLRLFLIDAGGSHAGLTHEYAAIPGEMRAVAAEFGREVLREVTQAEFEAAQASLRGKCSDRALLRARHYFQEERRVAEGAEALRSGDAAGYLRAMELSGWSSFTQLQNIYPAGDTGERSVALALSLCAGLLRGKGAWRVHGGGFAGTVQALVPVSEAEDFRRSMDEFFGAGRCFDAAIRPVGGWRLGKNK